MAGNIFKDIPNNYLIIFFLKPAAGDYTITIKFADQDIVGSPFIAHITNPPLIDEVKQNSQILDKIQSDDIKKIKVFGPGLEGGNI